MESDIDKIDEVTLALLSLGIHQEDAYGARAWKGFDWDTLNRLHQKGYIGDPVNKSKSVVMTPEGVEKSRELFEKYFGK
jgi:hypothetical protein